MGLGAVGALGLWRGGTSGVGGERGEGLGERAGLGAHLWQRSFGREEKRERLKLNCKIKEGGEEVQGCLLKLWKKPVPRGRKRVMVILVWAHACLRKSCRRFTSNAGEGGQGFEEGGNGKRAGKRLTSHPRLD